LVSEVTRSLYDDDFRDQWVTQTKKGAIGAIQFLAVILWAFGGEKPNAETDFLIVNEWAASLLDATRLQVAILGLHGTRREVTPFDPITYLQLRRHPENWVWALTVDNADDFLIDRSIGFKCSDVLAYWRGEDSPYSVTPILSVAAKPVVTESASATAAAALERASPNPLKTRQDNRLARLRELGGDVVRKNGGLIVKGITQLVESEAVTSAPARTEKTVRADLKAAYERETEAKRSGPFDGLSSR